MSLVLGDHVCPSDCEKDTSSAANVRFIGCGLMSPEAPIRLSAPLLHSSESVRGMVSSWVRPLETSVHEARLPAAQVACEDVIGVILAFANSAVIELLAHSLVDRQFHLASQTFLSALVEHIEKRNVAPRCHGSGGCLSRRLCTPHVARKFVSLPDMSLQELLPTSLDADAAFDIFSEGEPVLHCAECRMPVLRTKDIASANYRNASGRAYLVSVAHNVDIVGEPFNVQYTTGQYSVKDVSCSGCKTHLGVTYIGAHDHTNLYKVGTYLMGQRALVRPECCVTALSPYAAASACDGPMCRRCERTAAHCTFSTVLTMTANLHLGQTYKLYDLLQRQKSVEAKSQCQRRWFQGRFLHGARQVLANRAASIRARSVLVTQVLLSLPFRGMRLREPRVEEVQENNVRDITPPPDDGNDTAKDAMLERTWSATLKERLGMLLICSYPGVGDETLCSTSAMAVKFAGAVAAASIGLAPSGSSRLPRVQALVALLPGLACFRCNCRTQVVRATARAVRSEWILREVCRCEVCQQHSAASRLEVHPEQSVVQAPYLNKAEVKELLEALSDIDGGDEHGYLEALLSQGTAASEPTSQDVTRSSVPLAPRQDQPTAPRNPSVQVLSKLRNCVHRLLRSTACTVRGAARLMSALAWPLGVRSNHP